VFAEQLAQPLDVRRLDEVVIESGSA